MLQRAGTSRRVSRVPAVANPGEARRDQSCESDALRRRKAQTRDRQVLLELFSTEFSRFLGSLRIGEATPL